MEALESFDSAILLKPDYAEAHYNRGNALKELERLDEANESFDRAIAIDPNYLEANWNKGLTLLLIGNFQEGFKLYEWRQQKNDPKGRTHLRGKPRWIGDASNQGKTILVYAEQGLGDTIQFCRYLSVLRDAGASVLFAPQRPLIALMETLKVDFQVVDENDPK